MKVEPRRADKRNWLVARYQRVGFSIHILETLTAASLAALALAFARPELEGWGYQDILREKGFFAGYRLLLAGAPSRMFEPAPLALAWALSHGAIWGLALTYSLLLVAKYLAGRWAISPVIGGTHKWVVATIATVMLPWAGQWRGHNLAQQLAATFLIFACGCILRLGERHPVRWAALATIGVLLSLFTYEGLALCVIAMPFAALAIRKRAYRLSCVKPYTFMLPSLVGGTIYILCFYFFQRMINASYHAYLFKGLQPLSEPARLLSFLYKTCYINNPWTIVGMAMILVYLSGTAATSLGSNKSNAATSFIFLGLLFAPLLALPYAVNFYFLSDIERVGLPTGFGFFLLCVVAAVRASPPTDGDEGLILPCATVIAIVAGAAANAYLCYQPFALENSVIQQAKSLVHKNKSARQVLLKDWTGTLGDRYTFLVPVTLSQAMAVSGLPTMIDLCTPNGVERILPDQWQIGGRSSVPRCESIAPPYDAQLVLELRPNSKDSDSFPVLTSSGIVKPPPEGQLRATVVTGSVGGKEGMLWWINSPEATIALENFSAHTARAKFQVTFSPPPCPENVLVKLTVDGKSDYIPVHALVPYSFVSTLAAHEKKMILLQAQAPPCKPEAVNSRTFYLGLHNMTLSEEDPVR